MLGIDGLAGLLDDGSVGQTDPIEQAYKGCRERLGGLGVSLPHFRGEVEAALDGAPPEAIDTKLVIDDLYLVFGCRAGSDEAWRLFDQTYRGYLLRLATRYAGSRSSAEELITDLFHDLVTRPGSPGKLNYYKGYASVATWLAVIVRRMAMDRGRMRSRAGERMNRLYRERISTSSPDNPEISLERAQSKAMVSELFKEAVTQLEPHHRLVLRLLHGDGRTLREAGLVMDLDFSTVSRRAKTARTALRIKLEALARDKYDLSQDGAQDLFLSSSSAASFEAIPSETAS